MAVNRPDAQARPPAPPRVVDHIVWHLGAGGVTHIFGVDGAKHRGAVRRRPFCDDITAVVAKHEVSAARCQRLQPQQCRSGRCRGDLGAIMAAVQQGGSSSNDPQSRGEPRAGHR